MEPRSIKFPFILFIIKLNHISVFIFCCNFFSQNPARIPKDINYDETHVKKADWSINAQLGFDQ